MALSSITDLVTFTIAGAFGLIFFGTIIWLVIYRPQAATGLFENLKENPYNCGFS